MAWDQLAINRPHLVYLILGGFTSLFMLCSSVIKERLYIGEATVATICGIIFGPHAANLIDPGTWGNTDQITLEFSRIVLVVQCFAVGVELPKAYMERHWKSVVLLLVPVMTFGWLITSLFMYALIPTLNWLDSLVIAACVTATDPVLASSVVGKGKFAKRVPKHIRDILSAESGCNDGMAFPFIYLGLYLIKYRPHASEVAYHWICYTILYECIFGAVYGVLVGYFARRAIRAAHERNLIDRESFLVFYFVLALFCAGSGSLLGMDDLLIGFACGVGFSNDGWFTEKTEESHVSNVIDLLINLAFFVYFGTIIPWEQYNAEAILGLKAWRLVVIAILVLFFRRIPIMLALKPIIPDIKTWREAMFCGHFGPIGVGAIFVAILARAELESGGTTPLAQLPEEGFPHLNIIELIWPVTTFLVICSIVVHGSSVAVFTLGKHINTLTLTMSYTQANDTTWMDRLPRIQSRSKTSMSLNRTESSLNEKFDFPAGPGVVPKNFLRRQREEDVPSRSSSRRPVRRKKSYGGPISQSAIAPLRNPLDASDQSVNRSDESPDQLRDKTDSSTPSPPDHAEDGGEIYEEGSHTVYEDEEGNVLEVEDEDPSQSDAKREEHERREAERLAAKEQKDMPREPEKAATSGRQPAPGSRPGLSQAGWRKNLQSFRKRDGVDGEKPKAETRGPARAYQYGNTIIVEDEDGEVIKKYDINPPQKKEGSSSISFADPAKTRERMQRMGSYLGVRQKEVGGESAKNAKSGTENDKKKKKAKVPENDDDDRIRFTVEAGGQRMSKAEFIRQIQQMDPKSRARLVEQSNVPEAVKEEAREDEKEHLSRERQGHPSVQVQPPTPDITAGSSTTDGDAARIKRAPSKESVARGPDGLTLMDSNNQDIPFHDVTGELQRLNMQRNETAAQRRRREAHERTQQEAEDSEDDGTERVPPRVSNLRAERQDDTEEETAAERRRREGALGIGRQQDSDSEEDEPTSRSGSRTNIRFAGDTETPAERRRRQAAMSPPRETSEDVEEGQANRPGIRFADGPAPQRDGNTSGGNNRRSRHWKT
ncbi:hypothetical protein K461DRAFT_233284 [Myriangium duriaei CBS 260.36]|uniref:Sodium/hydrogen antiporter n=1 Tax=Myriangium duriaei CBS 260.36 TaxID=1168546 RepID=A0A9P4MCT6_9PEZI|nr:hypothetical protein K461DRAFT_233284 [Myriangium duriaei CBS 260.36]